MAQIDKSLLQLIRASFQDVAPSMRMSAVVIDQPCYILAIGKNALVQALTLRELHPDMIQAMYIHQAKGYYDSSRLIDLEFYEVDHPLPSSANFEFTYATLQKLSSLPQGSILHVLISGGGSAAFALPEHGISHEQYLEVVRLGLASGFDIGELNQIRSLVDQVKGGKLLSFLDQIEVHTWITSDVIDDNPQVVASGPTSPGIEMDPAINHWLSRLLTSIGTETKLDNLIEKLTAAGAYHTKSTQIVTTRMDLVNSLQARIRQTGYDPVIADISMNESVEEVSSQLSNLVQQFSSFSHRVLICAGEPTITLTTQAMEGGKGGRISALACLMAEELPEFDNVYFLGLATDGVDGSSPASGYLIDSQAAGHLRPLGGSRALIRNGNSGLALNSLGYGISFGDTDINLMDLFLIIIN